MLCTIHGSMFFSISCPSIRCRIADAEEGLCAGLELEGFQLCDSKGVLCCLPNPVCRTHAVTPNSGALAHIPPGLDGPPLQALKMGFMSSLKVLSRAGRRDVRAPLQSSGVQDGLDKELAESAALTCAAPGSPPSTFRR